MGEVYEWHLYNNIGQRHVNIRFAVFHSPEVQLHLRPDGNLVVIAKGPRMT